MKAFCKEGLRTTCALPELPRARKMFTSPCLHKIFACIWAEPVLFKAHGGINCWEFVGVNLLGIYWGGGVWRAARRGMGWFASLMDCQSLPLWKAMFVWEFSKTGLALEANWKSCTFLVEHRQAFLSECCWEMGRTQRACKQPRIPLVLMFILRRYLSPKGIFFKLADLMPGSAILGQVIFTFFLSFFLSVCLSVYLSLSFFFFLVKGHLRLNWWAVCWVFTFWC